MKRPHSSSKALAGTTALLLAGAGIGSVALGVSAAAPRPQKTITAQRVSRRPETLAPGAVVKSSQLGTRTFPTSHDGFALATINSAQYPAETTDGGATWHTDGPALHIAAAQAPLSVTDSGAISAKTEYAYGGGEVVDVTSDSGKTWWSALLGDLVAAVVPGANGRLVAFVQIGLNSSGTKAETVQYVSRDGGRTWRYNTAFGGGF
jgi:hypothetical protein